MQPGEVVRVEVTCACGQVGPRARAFGLDVPLDLSSDGARWQGLVGLDLEVVPGVYPLVVDVPHQREVLPRETALRVQPKQFSTRTLRVAPEFVDPPADLADRARREASLLDRLFKTITPRAWDRPFGLPLTSQPTRNFGSRSVFNGEPRNPHAGIDFNSPAGTVVIAPAAGTVVLASDLFFTGNTIVIDHGAGLYSLFAHLSSMTVAMGDIVGLGTKLGHVGATGRATGPHLHWGVRLNGARVDPLSLIVATKEYTQPRSGG
jgi:murein DD-endopeptidase MepM/ murein hydrolase activator NlpD